MFDIDYLYYQVEKHLTLLLVIGNIPSELTFYPTPTILFINIKTIAAIPALAGIVIIHA